MDKCYCVNKENCEEISINRIREYNYKNFVIDDNCIYLLNIKNCLPISAYRKDKIWYSYWNDEKLDINEDDIISFTDCQIFRFFKKR